MNFKNSEFLMLFVAFLIGYFFKDLTGVNLVEGYERRRSRKDNSRGKEDEVAMKRTLKQVNPNPAEPMNQGDKRQCPYGDGCMEVRVWDGRKNCIRVGTNGKELESCNPPIGECHKLDTTGHCIK